MTSKTIFFTDTVLRDAHQSLIATRMPLADMLPALADLDASGFWSVEAWGGATFDVCLRYLGEDPWERLRRLKAGLSKTRLQMLLRGRNLVGYRRYGDDVMDAFLDKARSNGVDVFRIFDALNDLDNVSRAIQRAASLGAEVEGCVAYTSSPVHKISDFVDFSCRLAECGSTIICVKDMAGILSPGDARTLVSGIIAKTGLPVHMHCHCASGMAPMTFLAAVEAGATHLDTALSPFSWGASHPPTETMATVLQEAGYSTGLNLQRVFAASAHFRNVAEKHKDLRNLRVSSVDLDVLQHQIPGGMISNLVSMLEGQKAMGRFDEVLTEVSRVRADLGFPPLVTPTSQMVGAQAVTNVLTGRRYAFISNEVVDYLRGNYGRPPAKPSEEILNMVRARRPNFEAKPDPLPQGELAASIAALEADHGSLEDAISHALFPRPAQDFFKARAAQQQPVQG